jgi:ribonucleoside-diphosphate reductase alpha chain
MITLKDYFQNDEMRMDIFRAKYLSHDNQGVDECFEHISKEIASVSCESDTEEWTKQWTKELLDGLWRPGGSIISAVNNKDKKISTFNCTTFVIREDTLKSIYDTRRDAAIAAAHRQGLGIEFSKVRPTGSPVNNSALESEGALNWMYSFDKLADEVGQKGRKPAILGSLKVDHPDIIKFITVKSDLDTLKNMNISVQITDDFMECLKNDGEWEVSFDLPDGNKISEKYKASEIWELLCIQSHKHAEPGIQFIDLMKRFSIQEVLGYKITSTNACSEKSLPDRGVCCLASLNAAKIPSVKSDKFYDFMEKICYSLVRFMDNVIQFEIDHPYKSPLKEQFEIVKDLREIGLGVTNLHQWLYDQGVAYDSDEGIELVEIFFKYYQYYTFKASCLLAKERDACPAWEKLKDNGFYENEFIENIFNEFNDLKKLFYSTGIRNGALLSVAPTGSISMTFPDDCLSSGIEPAVGYAYWRKTRAVSKGEYDYYFVLPSAVKKIVLREMNKANASKEEIEVIENFPSAVLDQNGENGKIIIDIVNRYVNTALLKPAHEIDPFKKVEMMGKVQKWIDAAISVTYNLKENFPVEEISKLYMYAYDNKLKALSIYRYGSREGVLIFEDPITHRKIYNEKNKSNSICKERPNDILYHCAPKRPTELPCEIHHCSVKGEKWIVLIGMYNNQPYEIFAGQKNDFFNISTNIKEGIILKHKGKYTLRVPFRNSYVEYAEITNLFMNEEYKALTRMISLSLRHGVYHEFIIKQLKKSSEFVSDFMAVVSRVLNKYAKNIIFSNENDNICPNCGELMIVESGCIKCVSCYYSKCE